MFIGWVIISAIGITINLFAYPLGTVLSAIGGVLNGANGYEYYDRHRYDR